MKALLLVLVLAAPDGGHATADRASPDAGTPPAVDGGRPTDRADHAIIAPDVGTPRSIDGEWWTADRANRVVITCAASR